MRILNHPLLFVASLVALGAACRGQLPPTQPLPPIAQDSPATSTNDAPTAGPIASDSLGSGGTNILPGPTPPVPIGGSGGAPAAGH